MDFWSVQSDTNCYRKWELSGVQTATVDGATKGPDSYMYKSSKVQVSSCTSSCV